MTTSRRYNGPSARLLAAAMLSAIATGLPVAGAQTSLTPQIAMPGERLRPSKPRKLKPVDHDRIAAAVAKRVRRSAIWSRRVDNGHQRQLATPRSAA